MSENEECESLQSEEAEVLASLYEGDENFSSERGWEKNLQITDQNRIEKYPLNENAT